MNRAVFLDRDGVMNEAIVRDGKPYPPPTLDAVKICDGVVNALKKIHEAGYLLIGITNQPDVSRGLQSQATVEEINRFLTQNLMLEEIFVCYHDDSQNCLCRKPKPGLILQAAKKYHIDLEKSFMVGDRWKDIEAGLQAGCQTVFIDYGYSEKQPANYDLLIKSPADLSFAILDQTES